MVNHLTTKHRLLVAMLAFVLRIHIYLPNKPLVFPGVSFG